MSMPFQIISCVKCGCGAMSSILYGGFVWRDDQRREAAMSRELGYCLDCARIVAKEKLPTPDCLTEPSEPAAASFFERLLAKVKRDRTSPRASLKVLEAVIKLGRKPVCLDCGSDQVISIPIPKRDRNDDSLAPTGVMHPDCGGEFVVKGSGGTRFRFILVKRVYDINGRLIETKPYSR